MALLRIYDKVKGVYVEDTDTLSHHVSLGGEIWAEDLQYGPYDPTEIYYDKARYIIELVNE